MKDAAGLFEKAIVQSACIEHFFSEEESKKNTRAFLKYAGVKTAAELKKLDENRICSAITAYSSWLIRGGDARCAFSPVIDGKTLIAEPKESVKNSELPLLIGNTSQEGNLFLKGIPGVLLPLFAGRFRIKVKRGSGSYRQRLSDALTRKIYVRPQKEILREYKGRSWRYLYTHTLAGSTMGCFHASELPVLFDISLLGYDGRGDETGKRLRNIWGRFARNGEPGWTESRTKVIK